MGLGGVIVAVGASACGGSGYQFVQNEGLGVYAKVPDDWEIYDERDLLLSSGDFEVDDPALDQAAERVWFRGFDSGDDPSVENAADFTGPEPRGFIQALPLARAQREQVNLTALRSFVNGGVDPVAAYRANPLGNTRVVLDEPAEFDAGYHGVHTVWGKTEGSTTAWIDQTVVLDKTNSVLFLFVTGCDRRCFTDTHKDEIVEIVDSWTIQEPGS